MVGKPRGEPRDMIEAGQKVHLGHGTKTLKSALSGIAGKIEKQSWKEFKKLSK